MKVEGAVFTDLGNVLGSGLENAEVCVACSGGFGDCDLSDPGQGLWHIFDVPSPDTCEVTVDMAGCTFQHVVGQTRAGPPPITIIVD
jgi:hypothetical protein